MGKYHVTIEGLVRKTIVIDSDEVQDEAEAEEWAHEQFVVAPEEGVPEDYNQYTINVEYEED